MKKEQYNPKIIIRIKFYVYKTPKKYGSFRLGVWVNCRGGGKEKLMPPTNVHLYKLLKVICKTQEKICCFRLCKKTAE